jgi:hypothetical protein
MNETEPHTPRTIHTKHATITLDSGVNANYAVADTIGGLAHWLGQNIGEAECRICELQDDANRVLQEA